MFFITSDPDFASYAVDNTPYVAANSIKDIIRNMPNDSIKLFKRLSNNQMCLNKDKCHPIVGNNEHILITLDDTEIHNCEKL